MLYINTVMPWVILYIEVYLYILQVLTTTQVTGYGCEVHDFVEPLK